MTIGCDINFIKNNISTNFDNFQGCITLKLYITYFNTSFLENLLLKIIYTNMVMNQNQLKFQL